MTRTTNRLQIDADLQLALRDNIACLVADQTDLSKTAHVIEAAVAAVGAAAIIAALLPDGSRQVLAKELAEHIEQMVEIRRGEIQSGAFDRRMERRQ
ncbi:hypothetical protein BN1110_06334 [bacterium YEK0313]|nr:hypothetical protein BN1110_06334 [bacterium YEK0313]